MIFFIFPSYLRQGAWVGPRRGKRRVVKPDDGLSKYQCMKIPTLTLHKSAVIGVYPDEQYQLFE
jgi:hypothetical protein